MLRGEGFFFAIGQAERWSLWVPLGSSIRVIIVKLLKYNTKIYFSEKLSENVIRYQI